MVATHHTDSTAAAAHPAELPTQVMQTEMSPVIDAWSGKDYVAKKPIVKEPQSGEIELPSAFDKKLTEKELKFEKKPPEKESKVSEKLTPEEEKIIIAKKLHEAEMIKLKLAKAENSDTANGDKKNFKEDPNFKKKDLNAPPHGVEEHLRKPTHEDLVAAGKIPPDGKKPEYGTKPVYDKHPADEGEKVYPGGFIGKIPKPDNGDKKEQVLELTPEQKEKLAQMEKK